MSLTDDQIDACLDTALSLAAWAVGRIADGPAGACTKDGAADWVTAVDLQVEREVRGRLSARFPGHRIRGEEFGGHAGTEGPVWYVDPIDGTTNFVHGLPWCSFSLAVADELGAAAGVVADPYRAEIFSAVRGRGARCDGAAIHCSTATSLRGGVVLTELSGTRVYGGLPEMMAELSRQGCVTRIMGSSALSLASVAAGRGLAAVIDSYETWDVLAGALIAAESGAIVRSRAGQGPGHRLPPGGLIAAAPGVADAAWAAWTGRRNTA